MGLTLYTKDFSDASVFFNISGLSFLVKRKWPNVNMISFLEFCFPYFGFKLYSVCECVCSARNAAQANDTSALIPHPEPKRIEPVAATQVITIVPSSLPLTNEPSLYLSFPTRTGGMELKVMLQPEEQHRARYLTEGSRGAIKDRSGQGYPIVKVRCTTVLERKPSV